MSFCKVHEKAAAELGEELLPDWGAQHVSSVGGPARHLVESWDYVEVCCGKNAVLIDACSERGLRCGPKIDILLHSTWDIRTNRAVEWLLFCTYNKRILHLHVGAPCNTFSIARHPKDRSREFPLGKDPSNPKMKDGNVMCLRSMLVLFAIMLVGKDVCGRWARGTHEHPASAFSWAIPCVDQLFGFQGCGKFTVSYCDFGVLTARILLLVMYIAMMLRSSAGALVKEHIHMWRQRVL